MLKMSNSWGLIIPSIADGTRPAAAFGTSITPGNNSFPAYTEIMADSLVTSDAFMIDINFNSNDVSTAARDTLVTLGFDFGGGTTYGDMTINHLLATNASALVNAGVNGMGVSYRFPIKVPAGTAIAAKASVNNGTVGTLRVHCTLYCKPSRPELIRYGTFVRTFGATTGTSQGTIVAPGTVSEGAYTDLGTLADTIWAWEFGYGVNDASIGATSNFVDIAVGDGSNKKIAILNANVGSGSNENISKAQALGYCRGASGDHVYGRIQCSGTVDTDPSLIAYGIGG